MLAISGESCLSVKRVHCDKTEEIKICPGFLYHSNDHLAWFSEKNGCWGRPFYLKFWVNRPWSEIADFQLISLVAVAAVGLASIEQQS